MQIIPTSAGSFDSFISSTKEDSSFADFFASVHDAINSMREGENVSASSALEEEQPAAAAPKVQSPYSRATTNGVTYTLDEVCFTKQELAQLRYDLVKAGAPETALKKLDALAGQPDGATLAQVMASLQTLNGAPQLSDDDKAQITSLLKKIDSSGVLDARVQQLMAEGKGEAALGTVYAFISQMDATTTLEVSATEALAFGRGLGLDSSSLQTLANTFGGNSSANLFVGQFSTLMAPASGFFNEQKTAQKQLDTALQTTLQPLVSKARARTEKEKQANSLRDRTAQQSKVLIDKTVQQKSNGILSKTLEAGHQDETGDVKVAAQSEMIGKDDKATSRNANNTTDNKSTAAQHTPRAEKIAESAVSEQPAAQMAAQQISQPTTKSGSQPEAQPTKPVTSTQAQTQAASQQAAVFDDKGQKHSDSNSGSDADKDQKNKSSWGELLGKVDVQSVAATGHGNAAAYAASQAAQNTQAVQNASADVLDAATVAPIGRQVAQQVEQGMLSTIKGGGSRLDLQLNPQELGTINVTLSVRNGEVSAIIRSEKSETADMINRQVDVIRTNLEQQGLKVDKVEVRQETPQEQNSTTWQDFNQHNTRQEEDARREELARLKNLATVRNSSSNIDISTLEQPVHSLGNTARYTTSNLNVVA